MDHLQQVIQTVIQAHDGRPGLAGLISLSISIVSATFAFITAKIQITDLHFLQVIMAMFASLVAIVSGGFAITYYIIQIRKSKKP